MPVSLAGQPLDLDRLFPAPHPEAWLETVVADLKGKDPSGAIDTTLAPGIVLRALYDRAPEPSAGFSVPLPSPGWQSVAWVGDARNTGFAGRVEAAVARGADAVAFSSNTPPKTRFPVPATGFFSEPATFPEGVAIFRPEIQPATLDAWIDPHQAASSIDLAPFGSHSTPLQLALGLAALRRHIDRGLDGGRSPADTLARLTVVVPLGRTFFVELAKLRALRAVAGFLTQAYTPKAPVPPLRILAETERDSAGDPHTHALRVTPMAVAAIVGGCDALIIHPGKPTSGTYDAAWDRLAINTHHVLRHEARLDLVADAAGGSWYVEQLTDALARRSWRIFQEMERAGSVRLDADTLARYEDAP